jgi:hypothetical protein
VSSVSVVRCHRYLDTILAHLRHALPALPAPLDLLQSEPMAWLWGVIAAAHCSGPLTSAVRSVACLSIAALTPFSSACSSRLSLMVSTSFSRDPTRAAVVALIVWNAAAAALIVQDGWCVRFDPARPYVKDETGAPHAWDLERQRDTSGSTVQQPSRMKQIRMSSYVRRHGGHGSASG